MRTGIVKRNHLSHLALILLKLYGVVVIFIFFNVVFGSFAFYKDSTFISRGFQCTWLRLAARRFSEAPLALWPSTAFTLTKLKSHTFHASLMEFLYLSICTLHVIRYNGTLLAPHNLQVWWTIRSPHQSQCEGSQPTYCSTDGWYTRRQWQCWLL